jgi:hypothetical protein
MRRYLIRIFAGWVFWATLYAAAFAVEASEIYWPRLLRDADVPDMLGTACLVAAMPVAAGGWLFVWGDGPQPEPWVTGVPFNVAVGLLLYGVLGLVVGAIYSRWRSPKNPPLAR